MKQLKPSEVYNYIQAIPGFQHSKKTFASNFHTEVVNVNERSLSEDKIYSGQNNEMEEEFNIVEDDQVQKSKPLAIPYFVKQCNMIITTPAHDFRNENIASDAQKIDIVLREVKNELVNGGKILVPICQENKILGLFRKGHFTMLEISKDNNGNVSAVHHDSKGFLSKIMYALGLYSLTPIRKAVTDNYPNASFSRECHGHQGMRDDVNCGRFVIGYVDQKVANPNNALGDPSAKFGEIQSKISQNIQPESVSNGAAVVTEQQSTQHRDNLHGQKQNQNVNGSSIAN